MSMMPEGYVQIGNKIAPMDKNLCENELGGKWVTAMGCIVNSRFKHGARNGTVYIHPTGVKKLPVLIPQRNFQNLTGRGGRLDNIHTYSLK